MLPPDEITVNGIFYTIDNISDGRGWYNNLRKWDSDSKYKKRKYLKGSFHNTCYKYKNCNVYDWRIDGDMDLIIRLHDGTKTIIKVRKAEKDILSSMKKLHMRLKDEQPNCRGNKCGDIGDMYSLGERDDDEFSLSSQNSDIQLMMKEIGDKCSTWFRKEFNNEFEAMEQLKEKEGSLHYMTNSPTPFMVINRNLANSSHYDKGDNCHTITTWSEETVGNTMNWKFIFPNVTVGYERKATAICLSDGVTISWDAALLRHGSTRTTEKNAGCGSCFGTAIARKKGNRRRK